MKQILLRGAFAILSGLISSAYGSFVSAQPAFAWDRTIGWEQWEDLNALNVLPDGIVTAGSSSSVFTFQRPAINDWSQNFVVVKLDFDGKVLWQKMYGGPDLERLWKLIPTSDGGFLIGGESLSGSGFEKTEPSRGKEDFWIVKLDALGNKQWDKTFGSDTLDALFALRELPGGGYLLGGNSYSNKGGDKSEDGRGNMDWWLIRIDAQGNKIWDKTIGGDYYDQLNDIELAPDGDVYVSGGTRSMPNTGEVGPDIARGDVDFWLVKLNPNTGKIRWDRRFGGKNYDFPYALCVAQSGTVYLGGPSQSPPTTGGGSDNGKNAPFYGFPFDGWVVAVAPDGKKIRDFSYGGSSQDEIYFIKEDISGSGRLVLGGFTSSPVDGTGTRKMASRGSYDYWMQGIEADGTPRWELIAGGSDADVMYYFDQLPSGAYVLGGTSLSTKGLDKSDAVFNPGWADFWVLRTHCDMSVAIDHPDDLEICSGIPVPLIAIGSNCKNCAYEWSTGAFGDTLAVKPGTTDSIAVIARDNYNCFAYDTVFVNIGALPNIDLGLDEVNLIRGETLRVGGADLSMRYQWNTGETTPTILITEKGFYAVTVTDAQGCSATDDITVREKKAQTWWAPNVFSPNGDGRHDLFSIFVDAREVRQVHFFQVADRWGNILYSRKDFLPDSEVEGWDGNVRGQEVNPGVYFWIASLEYVKGDTESLGGTITVVR